FPLPHGIAWTAPGSAPAPARSGSMNLSTQVPGKESTMRRRHVIWMAFLTCLLGAASTTAAQTPATPTTAGGWWTAWSSCDITPVQFGSPPEHIPGMADDIFWLEAETTNGSDID